MNTYLQRKKEENSYLLTNPILNISCLPAEKITRKFVRTQALTVGNEWFRTKVSTSLKEKTGYIDSVYPIACELVSIYGNKSKAYWKKEDIRKATEEAGDRIVRFIFGD